MPDSAAAAKGGAGAGAGAGGDSSGDCGCKPVVALTEEDLKIFHERKAELAETLRKEGNVYFMSKVLAPATCGVALLACRLQKGYPN